MLGWTTVGHRLTVDFRRSGARRKERHDLDDPAIGLETDYLLVGALASAYPGLGPGLALNAGSTRSIIEGGAATLVRPDFLR